MDSEGAPQHAGGVLVYDSLILGITRVVAYLVMSGAVIAIYFEPFLR